jgi:VanZ family protein
VNEPRERRRAVARWLAVAAWMGLIFALSSVSGLRVSEDAEVDRPLRALAHMAAFGMLSGLILHALSANRRPSWSRAALALVLTVLYAVSDELHQSLVPNRSGRLQDVAIDTLGALAGLVAAWLILASRSGRRLGRSADDGSADDGSADDGSAGSRPG